VRSRHALARFANVFAECNGTDQQAVGSEGITLAS
jgi:hypothetical protein